MNTAIIYSTRHGFTKEAVEYFRTKLSGNVEIFDIKGDKKIDLKRYDKLVIGGSIYVGNLSKEMKKFLTENKEKIVGKEYIIFFSSGSFDERYVLENIPEEIAKGAKKIAHFGSALNKSNLSLIEKGILMLVGRYKEYKKINEEEMDSAAKIINN